MPVTLVSYEDNESFSSQLTFELPESDDEQSESDSYEFKMENDDVKTIPFHSDCHVCASHVHHHNLIDKLLEDLLAVTNDIVDENDFIDSVGRFKVLLQGLEDQSYDGMSIFYHLCDQSTAPNPTFTVVKLIQLFDCVCEISATAFEHLYSSVCM